MKSPLLLMSCFILSIFITGCSSEQKENNTEKIDKEQDVEVIIEQTSNNLNTSIESLESKLNEIVDSDKKPHKVNTIERIGLSDFQYKLEDGTVVYSDRDIYSSRIPGTNRVFDFKDAGLLYIVDDQGEKSPLQNGSYILDDGTVCVVSEEGSIEPFTQAISHYTSSISLYPNDATKYYQRACAYSAEGNVDDALNDLTRAITINPQYAFAYNQRGLTFCVIGNYERALNDFSKAISIKPDFAMAFDNRGYTYWTIGNYRKAISDYSNALNHYTNKTLKVSLLINRGRAYGDSGKHLEAIADFTRVIEIEPNYNKAYVARGLSKHLEGLDGCQDLKKAKELGFIPAKGSNINSLCE